MKLLTLVLKINSVVLLSVGAALAASSAHGEIHGVPWSQLVIPQIVNFSIFVLILFFLLRKTVKQFFANKEIDFNSAVRKAAETKQAAENAHAAIQSRLNNLATNAETSRKEAIRESEEMKKKLVKEAQDAALRIISDAEKSIFFEHERAIAALRAELVTNSVKVAQEQVRTGTDSVAISGLQKGFSQKAATAYRGAQQ